MVHSHCSTNNTTTKTRVQKKKTICSASNRPNTCATSASSVHGFWWNIPWLLVIVACVTGTATGAKSIRPIQITSSVLTLDSCSADSQIVKYRESAITNGLGCPDGAFYLCGYDATKTFIVEYCQPDMECNPGSSHVFVVNPEDRTFVLKCLPCVDDWFEPEYTRSSRSSLLLGCTYKHKPSRNISHNLVLLEQGTISHATRWHCDILNGYYEEDGNMFCDDVPTKPCNCIHKTCQSGYLLRPDGRCVRCNDILDPHNNFRCTHENRSYKLGYGVQSPVAAGASSEEENTGTGSATINNAAYPKNQEEEENLPNRNIIITSTANIGIIVVVSVVAVLVVLVVIAFLYRRRRCICSRMDENEDDSQLREIQEVPQYASSTTDGSGVPETEEITRDTGSANGDSGLPDADEISQDTISGTEDIRHCKTGEVSQDAGFTTDHFSLCEAGGISQGSGSATDDSKCCKMAEILQDDSSDTDSTDEQNNVQEANVINIQKTGPGQIGNHNTYISRPKCVVINQYNHKENTEPPPPYNEQGIEPSEPELHVQRMDNLKSDYERTFDGHQSSLEMYQCTDSKTYERETSGLRMATLKSCADCKVTGQCDNEEEVMDDDFSEQSRLLYQSYPPQVQNGASNR